MDEEMEIMHELLADDNSFSNDIDSEYEFDACQFFDFTRGETQSEADEAESWFRYAHEYPPSPFILKLKMMRAAKAKANQMKAHNKTSFREKKLDRKTSTSSSISDGGDIDHETPSKESKIKGVKHHNNYIPQDTLKSKSKSTVNLYKQPSGSSFMKPTASHLAKQNKERDTHSGGHGRVQKPLVSPGENLRSPSTSSNQATKRQKLEIGYLRKVGKNSEMEDNTNSRWKTTIPHKPGSYKARPMNTKVGSCGNMLLCRQNSAPSMSESKNFGNDKCSLKACKSAKVRPIKDGGFMLNVKQNSNLPPVELFKKLSLKPELDTKVTSSVKPPRFSKGSKENVPRSFQRCAGKPNECGADRRITQVKT